jgi:hypothetical protein
MDCGRFTNVHVLTAIGRDVWKEFLGRFEGELAARKVPLPAEGLPDEEYFGGLRQLFLRQEGLPDGINDALHAVVELTTTAGYERLKAAIKQNGLKMAYDERSTPEDIALKVWLAAPDIMARQYNEQRLGRLSRFDYYEREPMDFQLSNPRTGGQGDLDALIRELDRWFEANDRGAETTVIERYEFNGEQWSLIRHGDSLLRSSKVEKRKREILHYRPAKDDVVVYSSERDELRINAKTVRALWRRQCTLERVLEDDEAIEPVKAEALRELEEVTEFLRKSPWRSRGGAERCVRAVTAAIKRLHVRLPGRWTPRASRIRCCRHLPATCTSTCWFLRAGAGDTPGDGLPRSTPGVSPTSRRGEWCGVRKAEV